MTLKLLPMAPPDQSGEGNHGQNSDTINSANKPESSPVQENSLEDQQPRYERYSWSELGQRVSIWFCICMVYIHCVHEGGLTLLVRNSILGLIPISFFVVFLVNSAALASPTVLGNRGCLEISS